METSLKTIIVDDESLARRGLKHRLNHVDDVEIVAEAKNGREALELIREHAPDLVFLDIQMPGMDGFDVLRALPSDELPCIVFVTAFDEYAIKAFEAHALDYLLKPVDDERLAAAVQRVREQCEQKKALGHKRSLLRLVSQLTGQAVGSMREVKARGLERLGRKEVPRLEIRDGGKTTWVKQADIDWIDAAGDYMCVHAGGETLIMRMTMKRLEQELDPAILQRVHRSTIVNVRRIREMRAHINGEYFLTLESGHTVKLSRSYKRKLRHLR